MPSITWSQSILAGATFRPLDNWDYERVPLGGKVEVLNRATAVGLLQTMKSGSDTIVQRSPVPAGGTIGVIPSGFDVPTLADEVAAGDKINLEIENPTGAPVQVDGIAYYYPG